MILVPGVQKTDFDDFSKFFNEQKKGNQGITSETTWESRVRRPGYPAIQRARPSRVSEYLGIQVSRYPRGPRYLCSRKCPGIKVPRYPGTHVSGFHDIWVPGYQGAQAPSTHVDTQVVGYSGTWVPGDLGPCTQVSRYPGIQAQL